MRLQVEMQQLQEQFWIEHGHGQLQIALEDAGTAVHVFELKPQMQRIRCQRTRFEPCTDVLQQSRKYECKRFEQIDGILKLHRFLKSERSFRGNKGADKRSAREFLKLQSFLAQTLRERDLGQSCKLCKRAHAPAVKGFQSFRWREKIFDRKRAETLGFGTRGDHSNAWKSVSGVNRSIGIGGKCDTCP